MNNGLSQQNTVDPNEAIQEATIMLQNMSNEYMMLQQKYLQATVQVAKLTSQVNQLSQELAAAKDAQKELPLPEAPKTRGRRKAK